MKTIKVNSANLKALFVSVSFWCTVSIGLSQKLTEVDAVNTALQNNQMIKAAERQVEYFNHHKKTGSDLGKLSATFMKGQYNTIEQDNNLTLTQSIPFPGTIGAQLKLGEERIIGSTKNLLVVKNTLAYEVKSCYQTLMYQKALHKLLLSQDSIYSDFARASSLRYKAGESNLLELTTAETQLMEAKNLVRQNEADLFMSQRKLQTLLKSDVLIDASDELTRRIMNEPLSEILSESNPQLQLARQQVKITEQETRVERNRLMPDFSIGYFNQTLIGYQNTTGQDIFYGKSSRFHGFSIGMAVPLWFAPQTARVKAASYLEQATRHSAEHFQTTLTGDYEQALRELNKNLASLSYYESSALKNADLILEQARKAYRAGEIGYLEYLQSLRSGISIKTNYLQALNQYNLSIIKVEYLSGKF
jgi:heavy metal efflux system protein